MHRGPTLSLATGLAVVFFGLTLSVMGTSLTGKEALASGSEPLPPPAGAPDLFIPGTQPGQLVDSIAAPNTCRRCHAGYGAAAGQPAETEIWTAWQGSMMAQSGRDPVFMAALDIANADLPGGGEFCLRCHMPRGWLEGRSTPSDASAMTTHDREGVQCEVCHRLVDPVWEEGNPERDQEVLAAISPPVTAIGSGSMIVDPLDHRRGPFDIVSDLGFDPHRDLLGAEETLRSPYHQEGRLCGTCHDISNPAVPWDASAGEGERFPIERTYSEWRLSQYNTATGVYAPHFGGNKSTVRTCQDCHLRDITGHGGSIDGITDGVPERNDMPLHDLTGSNTWVPQIIALHPVYSATFAADPERVQALEYGIERARSMLRRAADLLVVRHEQELIVTVVNRSGHKLPSGYVEGRHMWLQVEGYDESGALVFSSGDYEATTGTIEPDPYLKVYHAEHGLSEAWAAEVGQEAGASFHFILNNEVVFDNRIPPRGYNFERFKAAGAAPYRDGEPDPTMYADSQHFDTTIYVLPVGVVSGTVYLLHQVAAGDYIEFLRDNNPNPAPNDGDTLYDLWQQSDRSPPEVMATTSFGQRTYQGFLPILVDEP